MLCIRGEERRVGIGIGNWKVGERCGGVGEVIEGLGSGSSGSGDGWMDGWVFRGDIVGVWWDFRGAWMGIGISSRDWVER